jgi:hypothetical protein
MTALPLSRDDRRSLKTFRRAVLVEWAALLADCMETKRDWNSRTSCLPTTCSRSLERKEGHTSIIRELIRVKALFFSIMG